MGERKLLIPLVGNIGSLREAFKPLRIPSFILGIVNHPIVNYNIFVLLVLRSKALLALDELQLILPPLVDLRLMLKLNFGACKVCIRI